MALNKIPRHKKDRYFYVFLTQNLNVGYKSNHTPQHLTLVPPFCAQEQTVLQVAKNVARTSKPFKIYLTSRVMIGDNQDIAVVKVKPDNNLQAIHLELFNELEKRNIDTGYARFIKDEYTPHITIKKYLPKINEFQIVTFDHIAVMHKYKNIKTIIAKYKLGSVNEG
jgi:2'-5' RNA ligase